MPRFNTPYIFGFTTVVCVVCSLFVSAAAVVLKNQQDTNAILDRQRNVLKAAGLIGPRDKPSPQQVDEHFKSIKSVVIDLKSGQETDIDPAGFDQQAAAKDPATSIVAPANTGGIARLPKHALVYKVFKEGQLNEVILPIEGKGLWSTLYGYLALRADGRTIAGITFYKHGETPGLGGEVDNPKWQQLWVGREAYGAQGEPAIEVIKGHAGPVESDPHRIDGLSGATITSRGVSHFVQFWLGEHGFGPYLENLRKQGATP